MQFVHLGIYTEFSITESIVRIPDLVNAAVKDQMPALALTDLSNLHAAVKFYNSCLKKGIKPLLGSTIRLDDAQHRATLLAMSNVGWKSLTEIVSRGFIEGQQLSIPCVKKEWVLEQHQDIIVLLGQHSDVGQMLCSSNPQKAAPLLEAWIEKFGNRVYLALTRTDRPGEEDFIQEAAKLAAQYNVGVVAHNDVHFVEKEDFEAHEARVCIADGYVLADDRRPRLYSPEQHFKTSDEMIELFSDIPSAIENTYNIAKRCNVSLQLGTYFLPDYPIPDGFTIDTYFEHLSKVGLEERLDYLYPVEKRGEDWPEIRKPYDERIDYEVGIILKMGFPGYFLIVMDFIQWAKNNGVPVGPGRGSGAGSLVAYSLKITDLDPLRYDLLFERFLNPERVSMPDFDVDFCIAGRDRVIDYVSRTYGREAVSQIATFGTMAAKGAIRDVARVLGKSYGLADRISKMVPTKPLGVDLATAIEMEPQLKDIVTNPSNPDNDDASEIWEMALKLEGITRNTGKHAGGVVIAPGKITDFSAVLCDEDGTSRVAQYDKDDVEAAGLVKFDFLGLRNLTVIEDAIQNINKNRDSNDPLIISHVPLDDAKAYSVFADANTTAVFQFESVGMKRMLKEARPSKFEEIIAFVSLYRPGPMDLIPDFIHRMHGGDFEYLHPLLEGVLEPTYGIMVYQEQVMQTAQICAGYTLGGADLLRRAMGKKKPEEMVKQRQIFLAGAAEKGIDESTANHIFDYMEKFAGYGFNKSHAAAYALVAYHTAWLKAHYPAEFMAAVMSSEMQNTDSVVFLIDDCRNNGLEVLPPSVNMSTYHFHASDDKTIVYGLGAIKGVGEQAMQSVIDSRRQFGPYTDLFDFCHRIDLKKINKRTLEALIRAGALDCLGIERASLMAQLPEAVQAAEQARSNRESGIMDLFGEVEEVQRKPAKPVKPWSDEVRLKGEKDTLGLYLTGHPIDVYRQELKAFIPVKLNEITATRRGVTTVYAGLVIDVANFPNRVVIVLDDGTARIEVSCNHERFQRFKDIIQVERVVVFEGEIYEREGFERPMGRLTKAFTLNEIRQKRANSIQIKLTEEFMQATLAKDLQNIILPFCNVDMHQHITLQLLIDQPYAQAELQLGPQWKVAPLDELLAKLRDYFGKDNIYIEYQVKSKAAKAAEPVRPQTVASPPADMTMDDALDLYQSEVSQYS
ncbi:DNA polymerase III subunit alpha [Acinetobacter lactucae]|uniref:DNA polymerase III subunit alpha n=1 Tax=Acinetobacter lactucae TaxID=1785128 RepID=A0ABS1ANN1_9GAMM|nr:MULTISPECIES: DNA polymerase III subunit alpha [Acinetobacter calcoaceticus/baumannii complex]KQE91918.1 DNA polymerase III subunit alpha [Acinetobacter lactucae]MBJ8439046.1 DNA polymerase III subunit alpha [Acinetobacter lactucae]MCG9493280.1 DNA polymerase III subunit alpha [Acinetobacter pittii]MCG9512886.1 DNA polymerase III subunit alpha [Acinetobacter pittii]MCU4346414.1 DNA polymerase III subunit alpha [Acinetobacter lactucae]